MINIDTVMVQRLKAAERSRSVLILGGTGINFWYYYPLLRQFSLEELKQFKAVYGFSGGSGAYWFYALAQRGRLYEDRAPHYDERMRRTLNRHGVWRRFTHLARNDYVYHGDDLLALMAQYVVPAALGYRFRDFEMHNYRVVAHDLDADRPIVFSADRTPEMSVAHAVAGAAFPRFLGGRRFCRGPQAYLHVSDIEFAGKAVKRNAIEQINRAHAADDIYFLNLFKSGQKGNVCKIKVAKTRYPSLEQAADLCRAFFNWRNSRYRRTFNAELRVPRPGTNPGRTSQAGMSRDA